MVTSRSSVRSSGSRWGDRGRFALPLSLTLLALAATVLYPGWALLRRITPEVARAVLSDPQVAKALTNSLMTAGASTALAVLVGLPLAWLLVKTDIRLRGALAILLLLPSIVPPHIGSLAWVQVYGPAGLLSRLVGSLPWNLYSAGGVVTLLTVYALPPIILFTASALRDLPRELEEAARASGARPLTLFRRVVLPAIAPGLLAGAATAFAAALGNFGVPAMLGIPANYSVLTTYIYRQITGYGVGTLGKTAALSVILMLPLLPIYLAELRASRAQVASAGGGPLLTYPLRRWRPVAETLLWLLVVATGILPLIAMLLASLQPAYGVPLNLATMTLQNYASVLTAGPGRALLSSLWLAGAAALIDGALGLVLAYWLSRWPSRFGQLVRFLAGLPYAIPGIVLAVGTILAFIRPIFGLRLYGTGWMILLAYVARFLALTIRSASVALQSFDPALEQAGAAAGAGFWMRMRRIVIPLAAPGVLAGGMLLFLMAFSELTVSSLLASSKAPTIGVAIYNLEEGGASLQSTALATVTVAIILAGMLLLDRLTPQRMRRLLPWRL